MSDTIHPDTCKRIARAQAFFEALSRFEGLGDPDAYDHARQIRDAMPDCDCEVIT